MVHMTMVPTMVHMTMVHMTMVHMTMVHVTMVPTMVKLHTNSYQM